VSPIDVLLPHIAPDLTACPLLAEPLKSDLPGLGLSTEDQGIERTAHTTGTDDHNDITFQKVTAPKRELI
jgi:hypothetical protein